MTSVQERFRAWAQTRGSLTAVANELGVDGSHCSHIAAGRRRPSRQVAAKIERLSGTWPQGPIRVTEWDTPA